MKSVWALLIVSFWFGLCAERAAGAVIVITNRTRRDVRFTTTVAGAGKQQVHLLASGELISLPAAEGLSLALPKGEVTERYRLIPNSIYFFAGGETRVELRQLGLAPADDWPPVPAPPKQPAGRGTATRENGAGVKKAPAAEHVITIKLLVDDEEPSTRALWEPRLRDRMQHAARIVEQDCGLKLKVVAVETWESDNRITDFEQSLTEFEKEVDPAPARLAIGFTRQFGLISDPSRHTGGCPAPLAKHILLIEPEKQVGTRDNLEYLLHELGHFLGASHSPEITSAMRAAQREDQQAPPLYKIGYDPLNALVMGLVAEELRGGRIEAIWQIPSPHREKIWELYGVLAGALPEDSLANEVAPGWLKAAAPERPGPEAVVEAEAPREKTASAPLNPEPPSDAGKLARQEPVKNGSSAVTVPAPGRTELSSDYPPPFEGGATGGKQEAATDLAEEERLAMNELPAPEMGGGHDPLDLAASQAQGGLEAVIARFGWLLGTLAVVSLMATAVAVAITLRGSKTPS